MDDYGEDAGDYNLGNAKQADLLTLPFFIFHRYLIGTATNSSRCLSMTKSNASSFKSFKTFRTSSEDELCYVPSHRDSGILTDCDVFKCESFERQRKSCHRTPKRSDGPSHAPKSSYNHERFDLDMKDDAMSFEGRHFGRHETPSAERRQYPFAISNFLMKDYLGELQSDHEESYDFKCGEF